MIMSESERDKLINEIESVLGELDVESLGFLKEQADVLLYNIHVREKNAKMAGMMSRETQSSVSKAEEESAESVVRFEQLENEKFFNLCIGDARIFMDHSEVAQILKIAIASESAADGAMRLFRWFQRERKDVLVDGHIGSAGHWALALIYNELLGTFETG